MLLNQALDEHLNNLVVQSRMLLDDRSLIKSELKKLNTGGESTFLDQIWGYGKILEYLIQASRGRKRFTEINKILNIQQLKHTEVKSCI